MGKSSAIQGSFRAGFSVDRKGVSSEVWRARAATSSPSEKRVYKLHSALLAAEGGAVATSGHGALRAPVDAT